MSIFLNIQAQARSELTQMCGALFVSSYNFLIVEGVVAYMGLRQYSGNFSREYSSSETYLYKHWMSYYYIEAIFFWKNGPKK